MKDYQNLFQLKGKNAFVCGGLGLIGQEIAHAFMQAEANTIVLGKDNNEGELFVNKNRKRGYKLAYELFDVTDLESVNKRIDSLYSQYGHIDIWVNTAYPRTPDWSNDIEHVTLESWRKNVDMHLTSYNWISRAVCLVMKKQESGSLINLGSTYGILGNDPLLYEGTRVTAPPAYATIKGGIVNMTRYLASFFGKYHVRVNTLCPGGVYANQDKRFVKKYVAKTPLRRMTTPEDVAAAALYLASDASSYVTGTTFMVDGGFSCI